MKKFGYIFLIFFMLSGNSVLATGVQALPQPSLPMPSTSPAVPVKEPTHSPVQVHAQDLFKESLTPIIKPKKPIYLDSEKALEAAALAEITTYEKISLPEAIDYALSHNLDIKGNRINVDISKNDIKSANRLRNPYLTTFFNSGDAATDNPDTIGLVFPIDIMKRGARKNLAKSNLELTKGSVALAEFNLRQDVRQAYINLVAAKSILKILNDHRILLQELLDVAQRKYDLGATPEMDVIHAKMTLNQLLIQVNSANTDVYIARYNFNRLLNSKGYDTKEEYLPTHQEIMYLLTPKPDDDVPDFNKLLDIAFEKKIDLKNAKKEIDVAQKNLTLVVRQRIPDIELGAGGMFVPQQYSTDGGVTSGVFFVGNITNIPLLYQYTPEIKNAKLQVEQKQLAYSNLKNNSIMDLHTVYDEFITARDNLNYYNDILLTESKQFLDMAKRSYKVGKSNITDFIFIQQSYKTIMMGYTSALQYYYHSWVNLIREVNDEEINLHG